MNGLSPYAEDQVLAKQEERMWSSLFVTSEKAVVESAKGFTAQLQELSHSVEEADEVKILAISHNDLKNGSTTSQEEVSSIMLTLLEIMIHI